MYTELLADQLDFHWTHQLRPRFEGLTDDDAGVPCQCVKEFSDHAREQGFVI